MQRFRKDRDVFVARINRRLRWAHRRARLDRLLGGRKAFQAAVYDATFRSDAEAVGYFYALNNDHLPDFDSPTWFNEKIRWQFLHHLNPLMSLAADKIAVRDYLDYKNARVAVPELIAWGADAQGLLSVDLPARFVLKSSYGSGQIRIVDGSSPHSRPELARLAGEWEAFDQWRHTGELHYRDVPHRWLVEEYVPSTREKLEFKVFCFHGDPAFISVITERDGNHYSRAMFDTDWRRVHFGTRGLAHDPRPVPRPDDLDRVLELARLLSEDFLHVRVDFLKFDERLVFSELTFASLAARMPFEPIEKNAELGAMIDLGRANAVLERGKRAAADLGWPDRSVVAHKAA
jgi:hypothetical protein